MISTIEPGKACTNPVCLSPLALSSIWLKTDPPPHTRMTRTTPTPIHGKKPTASFRFRSFSYIDCYVSASLLHFVPLACLDLKVIGILAHSPPVTTWLDHNVQPKRPRIISTRPKAETGDTADPASLSFHAKLYAYNALGSFSSLPNDVTHLQGQHVPYNSPHAKTRRHIPHPPATLPLLVIGILPRDAEVAREVQRVD